MAWPWSVPHSALLPWDVSASHAAIRFPVCKADLDVDVDTPEALWGNPAAITLEPLKRPLASTSIILLASLPLFMTALLA